MENPVNQPLQKGAVFDKSMRHPKPLHSTVPVPTCDSTGGRTGGCIGGAACGGSGGCGGCGGCGGSGCAEVALTGPAESVSVDEVLGCARTVAALSAGFSEPSVLMPSPSSHSSPSAIPAIVETGFPVALVASGWLLEGAGLAAAAAPTGTAPVCLQKEKHFKSTRGKTTLSA